AALLEAQLAIARKLAAAPNDPIWLDASSRANLLVGDYRAAIDAASHALVEKPNWAAALLDLGNAHFTRALAEDSPADYGAAVENFSQALALAPDDPVALFNRALAYEQLTLFGQALADWDRYLRVERDGGWINEARQHRSRVEG